jgi:hypothetical protein
MTTFDRLRGALLRAAPLTLIVVAVAGCASGSAATVSGSSPAAVSSMSGMAGMSGTGTSSTPAAAGSVNPVPTQVLGTAVWQGMKITADAMTPVPFDIYNGTSMQLVKPPKNVSFHLMVLLNDAQTGVVIPYASVWGTITEGSKTPFDESL